MTEPYYTIDDVASPGGGQYVRTAVGIPPNSITVPTVGYLVDDGDGFPGDYHLYWKFTAAASGKVKFSGQYTYTNADPWTPLGVNVYFFRSLVGSSPSGMSDLVSHPNTSGVINVVAGTTYVIAVWTFATPSPKFVLIASDYGPASTWTQPVDEEWVLNASYGSGGEFHPPSTVPRTIDTASVIHTNRPADGVTSSVMLDGTYRTDQSFNGEYPATSARLCTWSWAAGGNWGSQWWSLNPNGPNPASWNGTDPYNPAIPGSGTCLVHAGFTPSAGSGGQVGVTWGASDVDAGHSNTSFHSYSICERLNLRPMIAQFGPWGGHALPTAPSPGASLEWEAPLSELLGLDVAPDQKSGVTTYVHDSGSDLSVQWYLDSSGIDENSGPVGWGPYVDNTTNSYAVYNWAGSKDIAGFAAAQALALTSFNGSGSSWVTVDRAIIDSALAYEDEWQTLWDTPGYDLSQISEFTGGLRSVALYDEQFSSGEPSLDYTWSPTGPAVLQRKYRQYQSLAYRVQLRPSRYRWHSVPLLPIPVVGVPVVVGDIIRSHVNFVGRS